MPWAYELDGPGFVKRVEHPHDTRPLVSGQIRLRFLAGGLCGSDMPLLECVPVHSVSGAHNGAPIHEIVGEVIESASETIRVGERVVGTGGSEAGLAEILVESDQNFIPVPDGFTAVEAVPLQSIATVLRAVDGLPEIAGRHVAVIGAGPIGLTFVHVLRQRGAGHITVIDPVRHEDAARRFGADAYVAAHSSVWAAGLARECRPNIVIEAVGHQQVTIRDALHAVADWGFVLGFGAADEYEYAIPFREMYERGLTLASGRTLDRWVDVLARGRDYLIAHRQDFTRYVTHVIPVEDAQRAYTLFSRPQASRIKVVLGLEGRTA